MQVRQVMAACPPMCLERISASDACRRMRSTGDASVIVLGTWGRIVGIVTSRDIALAVSACPDMTRLTAGEVMSRPVHVCRPDDDVNVALDRMARFHVRQLPVVEDNGEIVGLVSIDDIVLWGLQSTGVRLHSLRAALRSIRAGPRHRDAVVPP